MKRFIVFPGQINEAYQHDTLDDARASAKLVALSSQDAIVAEVHFTYEIDGVKETSMLAEPNTPLDLMNVPQAVAPTPDPFAAPHELVGANAERPDNPRAGFANP